MSDTDFKIIRYKYECDNILNCVSDVANTGPTGATGAAGSLVLYGATGPVQYDNPPGIVTLNLPGVGTPVIEANTLEVGDLITIRVRGVWRKNFISTDAGVAFFIGQVGFPWTNFTVSGLEGTSGQTVPFTIEIYSLVVATGPSGTARLISDVIPTFDSVPEFIDDNDSTFDNTMGGVLLIRCTFLMPSPGNLITSQFITMEKSKI
jgi:hypothetical protein